MKPKSKLGVITCNSRGEVEFLKFIPKEWLNSKVKNNPKLRFKKQPEKNKKQQRKKSFSLLGFYPQKTVSIIFLANVTIDNAYFHTPKTPNG